MHNRPPSSGRLAVLRAIPLLRACSDRELAQVEALVDDIEVGSGEILTREGRYEPQSFIIVSGEANITRSGALLATLGAGEFFGEMAMLAGPTRTATVTAVTPMHLLVLDPRSFNALLDIGDVAQTIMRRLVERLRRSDDALVGTSTKPAATNNANNGGDR